MTEKIAVSAQFRTAAQALGNSLSLMLTRMDERDEAEIEVQRLKADLAAAEARLDAYERRYLMTKEMMEPQSKLYLGIMEDEAQENLTKLRSA